MKNIQNIPPNGSDADLAGPHPRRPCGPCGQGSYLYNLKEPAGVPVPFVLTRHLSRLVGLGTPSSRTYSGLWWRVFGEDLRAVIYRLEEGFFHAAT